MDAKKREMVIKALECWASGNPCIGSACAIFCDSTDPCDMWIGKRALALIKELIVELDAMCGSANSYKLHNEKLAEENERLHASCTKLERKCARLTEKNKRWYGVSEPDTDNPNVRMANTDISRLHSLRKITGDNIGGNI